MEQHALKINELGEVAQKALEEAPDTLTFTVTLKGVSAARFYFIREIVKKFTGKNNEEIEQYLVVAGAERELERFATNGE
jgi:hypothetical protein